MATFAIAIPVEHAGCSVARLHGGLSFAITIIAFASQAIVRAAALATQTPQVPITILHWTLLSRRVQPELIRLPLFTTALCQGMVWMVAVACMAGGGRCSERSILVTPIAAMCRMLIDARENHGVECRKEACISWRSVCHDRMHLNHISIQSLNLQLRKEAILTWMTWRQRSSPSQWLPESWLGCLF